MNQQSKANDIDLNMIEFYNLNADYYLNIYGIEKRDYFEFEKKINIAQDKNADEDGKLKTMEMSKFAYDIIGLKRLKEEKKQKDLKHDLVNIIPEDSFDDIIFKMYE